MDVHDFAVIGAGIAGASVAYELQAHGRTILLEREPMPGQHTTGRSAAFLVESYGNPLVQKLTRGGRHFLEKPPEGFASYPVLTPRPVLWVGREDQREQLQAGLEAAKESGAHVEPVSVARARELCPVLREGYVAAAALEPNSMSIDVAGLLEAFLRGFRARGGTVLTRAEVTALVRVGGVGGVGDAWEIRAGGELYRAPVVVNAAGAWCDEVAALAGARSVGLQPLRRTVIVFDAPPEFDVRSWPCVIDTDEDFYLKCDGARLLASPCDEVPSPPCDATPEDYGVALAAERIQRATSLEIRHIQRRWAGLRSFVADRAPAIGMDPEQPGFFWLAGQGGFGIMTCSAAARCAASLIVDGALPPDLEALGLTPEALSPARLAARGRV